MSSRPSRTCQERPDDIRGMAPEYVRILGFELTGLQWPGDFT